MPVLAAEVGPIYDLLLATRDGTTLPCKNAKGDTVNLSQIALNFSVNKQNEQEEATELQHKKTVTQLVSSNVSDREVEQWPQISQGDWSGGMLQRLFGQDSDTSRYWTGEGILWPLTDWAPQKLLRVVDSTGLGTDQMWAGPAAAGSTFAIAYRNTTANTLRLEQFNQPNFSSAIDVTAVMGGVGTNIVDLFGFQGKWWLLGSNGNISQGSYSGGAQTAFATLPSTWTTPQSSAWGVVGNSTYVAFSYIGVVGTTLNNKIRLFNTTSPGNSTPASNAFIDLNFDGSANVLDMTFGGDNLYIAFSPRSSGLVVVAYNVITQTFAVVANLATFDTGYLCWVGGALFIIAKATYAAGGGAGQVVKGEMYLLQGTTLQDIGPLQVQLTATPSAAFRGITRCQAVGPYAVFGVHIYDGTNNWFAALAYDVLRGRLFKAVQEQILPAETATPALDGQRIAISAAPYLSYGSPSAGVIGDWLLTRLTSVANTVIMASGQPIAYNYLCAPQGDQYAGFRPARTGVTITSGIIDGTLGFEPKLWRQVQVKFTPLANDASCSVTLDIWLDQDPSNLSTNPQYTGTLTGTPSTAGLTTINLPINAVAIKLVYRLTITGGTATIGPVTQASLISASTPISIAAQVATGWVWNIFVDLAPGVTPNGHGNETTWARQQVPGQPTVDNVVAYNFIRQCWRMRGGRCTATWGNGDTWPALIQSESFRSPKPFGPSMRADQPSQYQSLGLLSIREDIA